MTVSHQPQVRKKQPLQLVLSIVCLVIGVMSLAVSWIKVPMINLMAGTLALVGLVLSIISLVKMARDTRGIHIFTIAGAVFSVIALLVTIVVSSTTAAANQKLVKAPYFQTPYSSGKMYKSEGQLDNAYLKIEDISVTPGDKYFSPTISVRVKWKNTSDDEKTFFDAISIKVLQNGKRLTDRDFHDAYVAAPNSWRTEELIFNLDNGSSDITVIGADNVPSPNQDKVVQKFSVRAGKALEQ
ncbi:hypothetical protein D2E26_1354 [Bifidobacterium dolichotidis]|uniref:DUF5067 domain-containing protein n=2 Tax=Bifidobacterium dolichotidis TaxID=2306976 RepID=A0A430FP23_9BIFI|nr:hypothetical protein D2E26_1354 [Bifidobacterium dolichotidis]